MNLNKKLCKIIDTDEGFDNQEMANKIEQLFNEELSKYQHKALKWDSLGGKVKKFYKIEIESSKQENNILMDIGETCLKDFELL